MQHFLLKKHYIRNNLNFKLIKNNNKKNTPIVEIILISNILLEYEYFNNDKICFNMTIDISISLYYFVISLLLSL